MKNIVVFLVFCGLALGEVYVEDIYYGNINLPKNGDEALKESWKETETDTSLRIKWYFKDNPTIQLAFDEKNTLAGVRLAIPKGRDDEFYVASNIFREKTLKIDNESKTFHIATVLLTDPDILNGGGRMVNEYDEIIESVRCLYKNGEERLQREACAQVKIEGNVFEEKKCKDNYGLVFAPFKDPSSKCDNTFFLVYNQVENGEMLGFGWLVPVSGIQGGSPLSASDLQDKFPKSPTCLADKTEVNIWLAKAESGTLKCENAGLFVQKQCGVKRRTGGDGL